MPKIKLPFFVFTTYVFFLLSCGGIKGISIPNDKKDYIGSWRSSEISLVIYDNGNVSYLKQKGSSKTEINAPIQKFEGNNFIVGIMGMNTTFVVSDLPHQDSLGVWKMTVDGVELYRE